MKGRIAAVGNAIWRRDSTALAVIVFPLLHAFVARLTSLSTHGFMFMLTSPHACTFLFGFLVFTSCPLTSLSRSLAHCIIHIRDFHVLFLLIGPGSSRRS